MKRRSFRQLVDQALRRPVDPADDSYIVSEELPFGTVATIPEPPRRFGQARTKATLAMLQELEPTTRVGFGYATMFIGTDIYRLLSEHFDEQEMEALIHGCFIKVLRELHDSAVIAKEEAEAYAAARQKLIAR